MSGPYHIYAERLSEYIKSTRHPLHHASVGTIEAALEELGLALVETNPKQPSDEGKKA